MQITEIAEGIAYKRLAIANIYFVGAPGAPWVLVDTGIPGRASEIREASEFRYGTGSRPECIILTHGHGDHAGSALELARVWNVPIYAHHFEFPYLTGRSKYPDKDPTVGGAAAFLSRFFPTMTFNVEERLHELPLDGTVPHLPGWRAIHTPGHAPGQVCLFQESRRVLLAGDAFSTINTDSPAAMLAGWQEFSRPPAPFTYDWGQARDSIERLAALQPFTVGCGHGRPMSGPEVAPQLSAFARDFRVPKKGRYTPNPAVTDEFGVRYLPPAPPDPLPAIAAAVGITLALGLVLAYKVRSGKEEEDVEPLA